MVSKKRAANRKNSNNRNHRGMQLLHDGAFAHRARTTTTYLNANKVNVVDSHPPQHKKSPDLNIIEIIWDELNRCLRRTGAFPTKLTELRANILYEWNNLPQNYVQPYATSINETPLCCRGQQCGGHTATKFIWTHTPLQDLT